MPVLFYCLNDQLIEISQLYALYAVICNTLICNTFHFWNFLLWYLFFCNMPVRMLFVRLNIPVWSADLKCTILEMKVQSQNYNSHVVVVVSPVLIKHRWSSFFQSPSNPLFEWNITCKKIGIHFKCYWISWIQHCYAYFFIYIL